MLMNQFLLFFMVRSEGVTIVPHIGLINKLFELL
jgi:hypothetical protein